MKKCILVLIFNYCMLLMQEWYKNVVEMYIVKVWCSISSNGGMCKKVDELLVFYCLFKIK